MYCCASDDAPEPAAEEGAAQQQPSGVGAGSPRVSGSTRGGDNPLAAFLGSYRCVWWWPCWQAAWWDIRPVPVASHKVCPARQDCMPLLC